MNPYPEHTPPAPPEGMKWEYRGRGWGPKESKVFYAFRLGTDPTPVKRGHPVTYDSVHYFEAVPDVNPTKFYEKLDQVLTDLVENPKESAGRKKCPMHLLSPSAMRETANALGHGAVKYKARNYRTAGVNATTYVGAILRHITAWNDGEDLDPESGLSHIAHVAACADILLDTMACGKMNDDRSKHP